MPNRVMPIQHKAFLFQSTPSPRPSPAVRGSLVCSGHFVTECFMQNRAMSIQQRVPSP